MNNYSSLKRDVLAFIESDNYSNFIDYIRAEFSGVDTFLANDLTTIDLGNRENYESLRDEQMKAIAKKEVLDFLSNLPVSIDRNRAKELQKRL